MKTVNKIGGVNGLSYTEFYGNSTDIKPTDDTIPNGSVFYEIDHNMQEYRWDKENSIWRKISSVTSVTTGGGTTATGDYLPLSGGTMQGAINMSGYQVENASELTLGETGYVGIIPHETTSETDNGTTVELSNPKTKKDIKLRGIDTPTNDNDTVNKKYADDIVNSVTENQVTIQKADNANMCINLTVNGDEASGILDLTDKNGNPVIVRGVDTPIQDTDAVNKKYFETHLSSDFVPNKDLDMKQYKLINTTAVEIYGGINDSANNTYFIRETSQASINTDTEIPEYVKVITGVHTGDTNQDVILRGIRAGQQKNDAVNYN